MKTHRAVEGIRIVAVLLWCSTAIGCAWAFGDLAGPRPVTQAVAEPEPGEAAPDEVAPPPAAGSSRAVKVEYNETADRTSVILQPTPVEVPPGQELGGVGTAERALKIEIYAMASHPGRRPVESPRTVRLVFACEANRPIFSYGVNLELRIDGHSAHASDLQWDARTGSTGSRETMEAEVEFDLVRRIGAARSVEGRLGHAEIRLGSETRDAFREFAEALTPAP